MSSCLSGVYRLSAITDERELIPTGHKSPLQRALARVV